MQKYNLQGGWEKENINNSQHPVNIRMGSGVEKNTPIV
jgi:hypothetical protein